MALKTTGQLFCRASLILNLFCIWCLSLCTFGKNTREECHNSNVVPTSLSTLYWGTWCQYVFLMWYWPWLHGWGGICWVHSLLVLFLLKLILWKILPWIKGQKRAPRLSNEGVGNVRPTDRKLALWCIFISDKSWLGTQGLLHRPEFSFLV